MNGRRAVAYPESRGEPSEPDEPKTLAEIFIRSLRDHDLANALNYRTEKGWVPISSAEMVERAENIALGLYDLGIRKGDKVAILAPNSPEWTLTDAGCQFAGVVDVPLYTTLSPVAVRYILDDSHSRILFINDSEAYERIAGSLKDCEWLERVVYFNAESAITNGSICLAGLESRGAALRNAQPDLPKTLRDAVAPDDVATLIYTSGTTGEPKGVMLSHANIISNTIDASEKYKFSGRDISLSVLPLSHIFERTGMYVYLLAGMAVHYARSIEKVPDDLREVCPTIFIGVPRLFEKVYEKARIKAARSSPIRERIFDWAVEVAKDYALHNEKGLPISVALQAKHSLADKLVFSKLREFFGGNLRFCITGGAALSDEIYLIFTGSGISIMQGYGLTETSPVISSNNPEFRRLGTVGRPIRNVEVRLAEDGEIEVTGPGVMLGYYHKPEANADAFTEDGWFRTGDIGRIDDDGYLVITDRKKELFKTSGGKYIAPSHIELMIKSSRFVSQVVLVGNERRFPAALIVPNFEMLESYAHLKELDLKSPADFCSNERIMDLFERQVDKFTRDLGQWERVKKIALLENELTVESGELTPTMKIKRRVIDEKYRDVIDELYR